MAMPFVEVTPECVEAAGPQTAVGGEPQVELEQGFGVEGVEPALAVGADLDQPRLAQHAQVLRDAGLADADGVDELAHGSLPVEQQLEDPLPMRFGDGFGRSHITERLYELVRDAPADLGRAHVAERQVEELAGDPLG